MFEFIRERHGDGTLATAWRSLNLHLHVAEWMQLATAQPQGMVGPALLCDADTPGLWVAFRRIFVLMVHNTRLESLVSKQKSLEHHSMHGMTVENYVLHHARMEGERELLTRRELRSTTGGARRSQAVAQGFRSLPAAHTYGSKLQRRAYSELMLKAMSRYSAVELYSRGATSIAKAVKRQRGELDMLAASVPERKFKALKSTHAVTATGRARKAVAPPAAHAHLAGATHAAGTNVAKSRGTGRSAKDIAAKKKVHAAQQRIERAAAKAVPKKRRDGGRMTQAQRRRAEAGP